MANETSQQNQGTRIYRSLTPAEKARHAQIRDRIQTELPELEQRGKEKLIEAIQEGIEIQHITGLLKAERLRQGLSLADLNERTNIDRSTLSKLESNADANPTIETLMRYAKAIGKKVVVSLEPRIE